RLARQRWMELSARAAAHRARRRRTLQRRRTRSLRLRLHAGSTMSRRNIPSAAQVRRWATTPPPDAERAPRPLRRGAYDQETPIRHGYTVADLSRIAAFAVRAAARRGMRDLDEKRSAAMCALIETLHAHECDPGSSVLIRAAEDAISRESDRFWSNWGYNATTKERQKGFPRYWHRVPGTPLDEAVTERVA